MKKVNISREMLEKIRKGNITQIILDENLENNEEIFLNNNDIKVKVKITTKAKYNSLDDCFNIIPFDLFGFDNILDAKKYYSKNKNINVYRIKYSDDSIEEILDKNLLKLIDVKTLIKNNVGHSSINVYEVSLKDGKNAILKIQSLSSRNNLFDEYERIEWLQDKCNVPKIYYYNEMENKKYLLMEKKRWNISS